MNRSSGIKLASLLLILFAAACAPAPTVAPKAAAPVEATAPLPSGGVVASAIVVPEQSSRLSFVISGTLKEMAVKEGDGVQAGQTLAVLNAPELEFAAVQAEAAARAAEFRYQYWIPARLDRPPERRQLAEQVFIQSQKALDTARAGLTQTVIKAPFGGMVVRIDAVPGEMIQSGQVIITVASLDHLHIETTDLSERDLLSLRIGQPATVFVEALGSQLTGKVTAISPIADRLGGDVVFKVTIELDSPPEELRWGMTAEVHIQTQ
jgi:RND family efflux transporter MFP subunit